MWRLRQKLRWDQGKTRRIDVSMKFLHGYFCTFVTRKVAIQLIKHANELQAPLICVGNSSPNIIQATGPHPTENITMKTHRHNSGSQFMALTSWENFIGQRFVFRTVVKYEIFHTSTFMDDLAMSYLVYFITCWLLSMWKKTPKIKVQVPIMTPEESKRTLRPSRSTSNVDRKFPVNCMTPTIIVADDGSSLLPAAYWTKLKCTFCLLRRKGSKGAKRTDVYF